ncbi:hypothetical protein GZL_05414 [Streptomyces sp. 769]|nr:hypothetical protein GZL_05414 [Streptomyces sp. 769]
MPHTARGQQQGGRRGADPQSPARSRATPALPASPGPPGTPARDGAGGGGRRGHRPPPRWTGTGRRSRVGRARAVPDGCGAGPVTERTGSP